MKYFNLFYFFVMICVLQWSSKSSMASAKAVDGDESKEIKIMFPHKRNYSYFDKIVKAFMMSEGIDDYGELRTIYSKIEYCHYNYTKKFVKCTFTGIHKKNNVIQSYDALKVRYFVNEKLSNNCKITKNTEFTKVTPSIAKAKNLYKNDLGSYDYEGNTLKLNVNTLKSMDITTKDGCTINLTVTQAKI
eukprot:jgi/Orpsp1_1/1182004/evm.model.c7180000079492.1